MLFAPLIAVMALTASVEAINERALRTVMSDSRFVGLVSPCTAGGSSRTTAGEWLRTAFHDAGSFDEANGAGGIDGSIAYELGYSENTGSFASATLAQYRLSQQAGVSLADLIVLGAITAVGACGGPSIPFYAGRIDAKAPVQEGFLPLPEQSTETHIQQFARMGFSKKEMISLVACGHSIGGVHRVNSPTITTANNAGFDGTRTTFDNHVAVEYMAGDLTNPLAQPYDESNPATSSDTRIFSSDGNTTISRYAASQDLYFNDCVSVFSRMFNDAIPRGTPLGSTPLTPFPVTIGFRTNLRNGVYHLQTGSARLFGMTNLWSSFDVVYTTRDGSVGSDANLLFVRTLRTLSNGSPIQIKDFTTRSPGVDPATGIGSVRVVLTLKDGSTYSSAEATETELIDDTIAIDVGAEYSCIYTSPSGDVGLNVSIQVLGPYSAGNKVELLYDLASDATRTTFGTPITADYRRSRDDTPFIYYGVFIPDVSALDVGNFAARITRADGTTSIDNRQGIFYTQAALNDCLAGAEVPTPGPRPSSGSSSANRRSLARRDSCQAIGLTKCGRDCLDIMTDLQACGGCPGEQGSVDCTELGGEAVECVRGQCLTSAFEPHRRFTRQH